MTSRLSSTKALRLCESLSIVKPGWAEAAYHKRYVELFIECTAFALLMVFCLH